MKINMRARIYAFCIARGMIAACGGIGYGREPGDVLQGVGGGIDMSAMDEARMVGGDVGQSARMLANGKE